MGYHSISSQFVGLISFILVGITLYQYVQTVTEFKSKHVFGGQVICQLRVWDFLVSCDLQELIIINAF